MAEMDQLFEHIDDIEIAMLTTRRPDGHLCSRAMATQKRAAGADLWFVTLEDSAKLAQIAFDPHVDLSYYKDRTREWVSVSGIATISRDRNTIHPAVGAGLAGVVSEGRRSAAWHCRRSADGADRRRRPRGGVSRGQQAAADRAVRARKRLGDGFNARAWDDAQRGRGSHVVPGTAWLGVHSSN